jgi:aminoglycoside phosphotransferase (APT) family kinase protein
MFNQGRLTGIIDWGNTGINNRAVDLAVIFSFYPRDSARHIFGYIWSC